MDVAAYLDRINYQGPLEPAAETLRRLQLAHLFAVPFENLSIHAGEAIVLSDEALFEKIVVRRRGGFCYELNGLFAALLRALGFDVIMLSAEVMGEMGDFSPEFDHMALLVALDERWLVDVGFGDSFREPLRLDVQAEQRQLEGVFRLRPAESERLVVGRRDKDEAWTSQYRFALEPHVYADFSERCLYHQTSPHSHFRKKRVVSLATPEGRVTLSGSRMIKTRRGRRRERELADEGEFAQALREIFGIVMPASST